MTEKEAKKLGYTLIKGSYHSSTDDSIGSWYWSLEGQPLDKRGSGHTSKQEALNELERELKMRTRP